MAKLTREILDELVDGIYVRAENNLTTQGFAAEVLMGLDQYGRNSLLVTKAPPDEEPQIMVAPVSEPLYALPCNNLQEQTSRIAELVRQTRTVAAIHVTEAWTLLDPVAVAEVMASGTRISEREDRAEVLLVSGHWPQEFYSTARTALIARDDDGNPYPHRYLRRAADASMRTASGTELFSWVNEILPGPPGRG